LWIVLLAILIAVWLWPEVWERFVSKKVLVKIDVVNPIVDYEDPVAFHCTVINTSRLPCPRIRFSIRLPEQLDSGNPERREFAEFSTYVMPLQQADVTFEVNSIKRGFGKLVQAEVLLVDGLGLRRRFETISLNVGVVVRPKRGDALVVPTRLLDLVGDIRVKRFYNEDPSLLQGIRPYQDGDSMKYVSWYATARTQQLMVKQFGYTTTARCLIVFAGSENYVILDYLCERVVHLTEQLLNAGLAVGMYSNMFDIINRSFFVVPSSAPEQLETIRTRMGSIEAIPFTSLANLLYTVPKFASSGDMVIVLTEQVSATAAAALQHVGRSLQSLSVYLLTREGEAIPRLRNIPLYVETLSDAEQKLARVGG